MYESLDSFPLRKINFVKTRTTILNAVSHLLKEKNFAEITVDEICQRAQISRGTFFNYFSTKEHVFHYYLRIFTIRIALRAKELKSGLSFKEQLNSFYGWLTDDSQYAKFIDSYISFLLNVGEDKNEMKLTDAEFVYFFNNINEDEYTAYNELTLQQIFADICTKANDKSEVKISASAEELGNLLSGVIIASYVTDHIAPNINHLDIFDKILVK
ncbi:MAG: TetR family transcriptional regulator [Epulopiscium sp. Nele67-Bin004]|nr:MAG: TetR family transcriptional regulator [Epulopiscium sp. Nele67-Bin004]